MKKKLKPKIDVNWDSYELGWQQGYLQTMEDMDELLKGYLLLNKWHICTPEYKKGKFKKFCAKNTR